MLISHLFPQWQDPALYPLVEVCVPRPAERVLGNGIKYALVQIQWSSQERFYTTEWENVDNSIKCDDDGDDARVKREVNSDFHLIRR